MNDNDPIMKMYEAQAIVHEKEEELKESKRELERKNKELEEARREIERLRVINQQLNLRDAVPEMEKTFNARFLEINQKLEDIFLQLSNLQQATDKKTEEDLRIERAAELMKISSKLDVIYSELNPHTSVILLGGMHTDRTDSICMFNSKENKWINSHFKLPDNLSHHGSVIFDGEIYIFGGYNGKDRLKSTYKLGENGEWIKLADMNEKRSGIRNSSVVFEDEIWVFGGMDGTNIFKTVEKYNPKINSWTQMTQMNQARNPPAVSIINGKFYVSGGFDGRNYLDSIEAYNPEKKKWEMFCNMPFALCRHASIVDGTNLIIIGGNKSKNEPSSEVWKIDVMDPQKEWKKMPNLQQPRYYHGAVKLEDGLMVIGGEINDKTRIDSVKIFDGQKWIEGPKLPEKRGSFSLIPLTNKNEKNFLRRLRSQSFWW